MKLSTRLLCAAIAVLAFLAIATEVRAQYPQCNGTEIIIRNGTKLDARVCIKWLKCYDVPAGTKFVIPVVPGTQIPGIAGAANITHTWTQYSLTPPLYWIPSVQLPPTNQCFDIFYDPSNCVIDLQVTSGPPCLNP